MNRIYRLVWNRALRVLQVASELAHAQGGDGMTGNTNALRRHPLALACVAALGMASFAAPAWSANCPAGTTGLASSNGAKGSTGSDGNGTNGSTGSNVASGSNLCFESGYIGGGRGGDGAEAGGTGGAGGTGLAGSGFKLANEGYIYGGNGGYSYHDAAGAGGVGISGDGFTLTNSRGIFGGSGGSSEYGAGGAGGASVTGSNFKLVNDGRIGGGDGGNSYYATTAGAGGTGVSGSGFTLTNNSGGEIYGGAGGYLLYGTNGTGGTGGTGGGGAGISGSDFTLVNDGHISGGSGASPGGEGGGQQPRLLGLAVLPLDSIGTSGSPGYTGGAGGVGVVATGTSDITNASSGLIVGGEGGYGYSAGVGSTGYGGAGGAGVTGSGFKLTNQGEVGGGAGGAAYGVFGLNGSNGTGGVGGVAVSGSGFYVDNSATLHGGQGGAGYAFGVATGGDAGAGVAGSGFTVVNRGLILGGRGGYGRDYVGGGGSGYVSTGGAGGAGISIDNAAGATTTINNASGAVIAGGEGGTAYEVGIAPAAGNLTVIAYGGVGGAGIAIDGAGTIEVTNAGVLAGGYGGYAWVCSEGYCSYAGTGGTGGAGIHIAGSGSTTITNTGYVYGGTGGNAWSQSYTGAGNYQQGTAGMGGAGINAGSSGSTTIDNSGLIMGGTGGYGYGSLPAAGGAGVTGTGFTLTNSGGIHGGYGNGAGSQLSYRGGTGGAGVSGSGFSVTNTGAIVGGEGGSSNDSPGAGGVGIDAMGRVSITTSGNIMGGMSGNGSTQADAVDLSGGGNVLTLEDGYSFTGNVISTSGAQNGDTLVLGGTADSTFDVSAIAAAQPTAYSGSAQYYGFARYTKTGNSTWTLTDTTTAVTPWSIDAGTLSVSSDTSLGDAAGALTLDDGTLQNTASFATKRNTTIGTHGGTFQTDADLSDSGVISGTGALTKTGTAALILTGANTWSGGTTISAGTLQLGNGGTTGSIVGNVTDNGTLAFDRKDDVSFAGVVSGSGALVQAGAGTLTLTGANTYKGGTTVSAGTLAGNVTSLHGAITDNAALVFTQTDDGTFDGTLSGTGTLAKTGAGELIINSSNPGFTGDTTVKTGSLIVGDDGFPGASLGGAVAVAKGALLGGFGTVGGLDLAGTLAPGHSIGTLHVAGNATFQPGSTWQVEVDPNGKSDQLDVTGTALLQGGNVTMLIPAGTVPLGTDYTILQAQGSIQGQFDSVDTNANLTFLEPTLTYLAHTVTLALERNDTSFADVARTRNQKATAAGAENLGQGNPVYNAIVTMDANQARDAFDQLSGEWYASSLTARLHDSRYVREAMNQRLTQAGAGNSADAMRLGHTAGTVWFHAWGQWGDHDGDGNAARMRFHGSGLLVGVDAELDHARIGGVLGASRISIRDDQRSSDGHDKATWLGVYGSTITGPVHWRAGLAYARDRIDGNRRVTVPGLAGTLGADPDGHTEQAWVEAALPFASTHGHAAPFLNLAHVRVATDGWREDGSPAALQGSDSDAKATLATLGIRSVWTLANAKHPVQFHGRIGWRQAFGTDTPQVTMRIDGSTPFAVYGLPLAQHAIVMQAGLDFTVSRQVSFDVGYSGQFASHMLDQGGRVALKIAF